MDAGDLRSAGTRDAKTLQRLGFTGSINPAFIERLNLTLRHGLAALTRRSWATAHSRPPWKRISNGGYRPNP